MSLPQADVDHGPPAFGEKHIKNQGKAGISGERRFSLTLLFSPEPALPKNLSITHRGTDPEMSMCLIPGALAYRARAFFFDKKKPAN